MNHAGPRIALGTMHFGTKVAAPEAHALLDEYLDLGGEWIDTANCYAFWASESGFGGQSESVIGEWLAKRHIRDRVKIGTKVGVEPLSPGGYPDDVENLSRANVRNALEKSLGRLGTDHVEMYWAHREDRTHSVAEVTDAFADVVNAGLASATGLSNHPAWYLAAANTYAEHAGIPGFSAAQLRESYLHPRPDVPIAGQDHPNGMMTAETKDFAAATGLQLWAYTPLMTGAYEHPERPLPEAYNHPGTHARLQALRTWSAELNIKPSQLVLAWLLAQNPRITPIVGVSNSSQLREAFAAISLALPAPALKALNETA